MRYFLYPLYFKGGHNMAEIGSVIDAEENKVVVKLKRTEACAKCRACTAGLESKDMIIKAYNQCGAEIGDNVEIVLEESNFIAAVAIMYGLPFLSLIIGTAIGIFAAKAIGITNSELIGFIIGIVCVCVTYMWIKSKETYWKSKNFVPKAIKKV